MRQMTPCRPVITGRSGRHRSVKLTTCCRRGVVSISSDLTPLSRLRLARLAVEDGCADAAAAKMFMVAPRTAAQWAQRYRPEGSAA